MTGKVKPGVRVRIKVVFNPADHDFESQKADPAGIGQFLQGYAEQLVQGLGLPVRPVVEVLPGAGKNAFPPVLFQVTIAGRACRQSLLPEPPEKTRGLDIARQAARVICRNRELFLTGKVLKAFAASQMLASGADSQPNLPEVDFILMGLMHSGLGAGRLQSYWASHPDHTPGGSPEAGLLEAVFIPHNELSIQVYLAENTVVRRPRLEKQLSSLVDWGFSATGVIIPKPALATSGTLQPQEFQIRLNDLWLPAMLIPSRKGEAAIIEYLQIELKRNISAFLSPDLVRHYLEMLKETHPELVNLVLQRIGPVVLARVLCDLLDEGLVINDLPGILEGLAAVNGGLSIDQVSKLVFYPNTANFYPGEAASPGFEDYVEGLRLFIKRATLSTITGGGYSLGVLTPDSDLERLLQATPAEESFDESDRQRIMEGLYDALLDLPADTPKPVILTILPVRRRLKHLISEEFPDLPVISFQETLPELRYQSLGYIV